MTNLFASLLLSAAVALSATTAFAQATKPAAGKSVSGTDKKFVKDVADLQVQILHLTDLTSREESPGGPAVKALTKPLAADLNTGYGELGTLAQAKGAPMPETKKDAMEKKTIEGLQKAKPTEFDKLFLKSLEKDVKKLNTMVEGGAKSLTDAELKGWAEKWAPKLKTHYEAIGQAENEGKKK